MGVRRYFCDVLTMAAFAALSPSVWEQQNTLSVAAA